MPRTLPWLQPQTHGSKKASSAPLSRVTNTSCLKTPPVKRGRLSISSPGPTLDETRRQENKSASYAPESDLTEPVVEFMRPGFYQDDRYIMVEDEFLDVARLFTRPLHRVEYDRLQSLASAKNADNITEIQRPVDGVTRMSKETLIKQERISKAKRTNELLKGVQRVKNEGDSDDEDIIEAKSQWIGTSLGQLMMSPRKREKDLSSRWQIKATTKAAAGYLRSEGSSQDAGKLGLVKKEHMHEDSKKTVFLTKNMTKGKHFMKLEKKLLHKKAEYMATDDGGEDDLDTSVIKFRLKHTQYLDPLNAVPKPASHILAPSAHSNIALDQPKPCLSPLPASLSVSDPLRSKTAIAKISPTNAGESQPNIIIPAITKDTQSCKIPQTVPTALNTTESKQPDIFDPFMPSLKKSSVLKGGGYRGKAMAALAAKREREKQEAENQRKRCI